MLADENVEIVVGRVSTCVAFCAERSAEDDQILRDAGMYDEHVAHGASCVVPDPFVRVWRIVGNLTILVDRKRGGGKVRVDSPVWVLVTKCHDDRIYD